MVRAKTFTLFILFTFIAPLFGFAEWSVPVFTGITDQVSEYNYYWDNESTRIKFRTVDDVYLSSGYLFTRRRLQVWSDWENNTPIEVSTSFPSYAWSASTEWSGNENPPARDFFSSIGGCIYAHGAGYYDYINERNGYAEAEGRSAVGTKIQGQILGNTQSDQQSQEAIAAVRITESLYVPSIVELTKIGVSANLGFPPSVTILAEFQPKPNYENPDTNTVWFNNAIASLSGYYQRWTINWQCATFNPLCQARGSRVVGGVNRASTSYAEIYLYFQP